MISGTLQSIPAIALRNCTTNILRISEKERVGCIVIEVVLRSSACVHGK